MRAGSAALACYSLDDRWRIANRSPYLARAGFAIVSAPASPPLHAQLDVSTAPVPVIVLLRTALQLAEVLIHAEDAGVLVVAIPAASVGYTGALPAGSHIRIAGFGFAVPCVGRDTVSRAALRAVFARISAAAAGTPDTPILRQVAPEVRDAATMSAAKAASTAAIDLGAAHAFTCGSLLRDLIGACRHGFTAPGGPHEEAGQRLLVSLVLRLTQVRPEDRIRLPAAAAALAALGVAAAGGPPPALPADFRMLPLAVDVGAVHANAAAAAAVLTAPAAIGLRWPGGGEVNSNGNTNVTVVCLPVWATTTVGDLSARAVAAAEGRFYSAPNSQRAPVPLVMLVSVSSVAGLQQLRSDVPLGVAWPLLCTVHWDTLPTVFAAGPWTASVPLLAPAAEVSSTDEPAAAFKLQQLAASATSDDTLSTNVSPSFDARTASPHTVEGAAPNTPPRVVSTAVQQQQLTTTTAAASRPQSHGAQPSRSLPAQQQQNSSGSGNVNASPTSAATTTSSTTAGTAPSPAPSPPLTVAAPVAAAGVAATRQRPAPPTNKAGNADAATAAAAAAAAPSGSSVLPIASPSASPMPTAGSQLPPLPRPVPTPAGVGGLRPAPVQPAQPPQQAPSDPLPQRNSNGAAAAVSNIFPVGAAMASGIPTSRVSAAALASVPGASAEDAAFVAEAAACLRPFGIRSSITAGRLIVDVPRVPAAGSPAVTALVVAGAARAAAPAREQRTASLRDALREMQDRTHTRNERRLAVFGALGLVELSLSALYAASLVTRDEQSAAFGLQTVGNLAMVPANRERLAALHGIEAVTACMSVHEAASRVQKDALVALRHLAYENDANKQRIVDCGAVAAVVRAMLACGDNAQVQKQAAGSLSIFAVHSALGDAAKRTIVDAGGLRALTRALTAHAGDTQLAIAALKALGTLVNLPDARSQAKELGAIELCDALVAREEHAGSRDFIEALRTTQRRLNGGKN